MKNKKRIVIVDDNRDFCRNLCVGGCDRNCYGDLLSQKAFGNVLSHEIGGERRRKINASFPYKTPVAAATGVLYVYRISRR